MMEPCCALKYYPAVEVCQNEKVATYMDKIIVTIHIISIVHIIVMMIILIIHVYIHCSY